MNRSRATTWSLTAAAFLLVLGVPSAIAKPKIASGSQCSANWVNNAGAMQCFIQGEEESHSGVSHPHYVACAGGDIFCCQDNDNGDQDCVAQASTRPPSKARLDPCDPCGPAHAPENRRATGRQIKSDQEHRVVAARRRQPCPDVPPRRRPCS
jgi:hypothetical protein